MWASLSQILLCFQSFKDVSYFTKPVLSLELQTLNQVYLRTTAQVVATVQHGVKVGDHFEAYNLTFIQDNGTASYRIMF